MNLALVGYGRIAPKHLEAFRALGARFVACCNRSAAGRAKATSEGGIEHTYASIEEMLDRHRPDVYAKIVAADRASVTARGGHGNAIAQIYNHMIMPLATRRDKVTQTRWGIEDFRASFGREPEGLWLPETAVDNETLEVLAEAGVKFTILAPHQAFRARPLAARAS